MLRCRDAYLSFRKDEWVVHEALYGQIVVPNLQGGIRAIRHHCPRHQRNRLHSGVLQAKSDAWFFQMFIPSVASRLRSQRAVSRAVAAYEPLTQTAGKQISRSPAAVVNITCIPATTR